MSKIQIYHYPACTTCKRALQWLKAHAIAHEAIHIVQSPPTAADLQRWLLRSGLPIKRFFNTAGESYRAGQFAKRLPDMSEAQMLEALASDGKLIKRPLLITEQTVLVGFDEAAYAQLFTPKRPINSDK